MSRDAVDSGTPKKPAKPLSLFVCGCIAVGVLALGLVALGVYTALPQIREVAEATQLLRQQPVQESAQFERVRGGILHGQVMSPDADGVLALAWRDETRLTFVDIPRVEARRMRAASL